MFLSRCRGWTAASILLLAASQVSAGMMRNPVTLKLTSIARLRLESLSFFIVAMLLLTLVVQWIWNGLRRDFPRLPRLSYLRTLGMMVVWGLAVCVVLSMINGARELVTPGAWERAGALYELGEGAPLTATQQVLTDRQRNLERLRDVLWDYARARDGRLPPHEFVPEIPQPLWATLHPSGVSYVYIGGRQLDGELLLVACEPSICGDNRFALLSNGQVQRMTHEQIVEWRHRLPADPKRSTP